jgi:hypothetical protein
MALTGALAGLTGLALGGVRAARHADDDRVGEALAALALAPALAAEEAT